MTAPAPASTPVDQTRSTGYLPGLDGVRAIAVTAVLLFHLGLNRMSGGFLGVDVFFTLSGFLITGILLNELGATGAVRFGRFYLRRARRLLPALVLMLVGTSVPVLLLARDAAHELGEDARASALYLTNWWYVLDARSYFETTGRPPLLHHLWSLAIEEQFYLVWPLIVVAAYRWGGRRRVALVAAAGAVGSTALMAGLAISGDVPSATDSARVYFGTDTHAMTLLVGAVLAVIWNPYRAARVATPRARTLVTAGSSAAAIGLLACFVWVDGTSGWLYRGGFLVVGLLTAGLIVGASLAGTRVAAVLSVPPLLYLGTRSYGIYLWHWPVFQLTRPELDLPVGGVPAMVISLAVTIGVAELSYRFVEMPIRRGALGRIIAQARDSAPARTRAVTGAAAVVVLVVGLQVSMAGIPAPSAADYLGGKEAVGAGALTPGSGAGGSPPGSVTAVGDSVLLGARRELRAELRKAQLRPIVIDAAIARQPDQVFDRVAQRHRLGRLGRIVVIGAGTNGIATRADLGALLRTLDDRERVVLLTTRAPVPWVAESNANIRAVAARSDNVVLVDWAQLSHGHREYFYPDGVHLRPKGARAFGREIARAARAGRDAGTSAPTPTSSPSSPAVLSTAIPPSPTARPSTRASSGSATATPSAREDG